MEWFGITQYGFQDPIKDMMRPDYIEPTKPEVLDVENYNGPKRFAELVTELDVYLGHCDGYAYKSYDRLIRMRKKGMFKPVGPYDMYKYPGTRAMIFGWFIEDEALKNETWFKPITTNPKPSSEMSRFVNHALKSNKFFKL